MAEVIISSQPKIAVLGSNGFLGSTIVRQFTNANIHCISLNRSNYPDIFDFDCLKDMLVTSGISYVINCISYNGYEKCYSSPLTAFEINTLYPKQLSIACNSIAIKLIHFSSEAVFRSSNHINSVVATPCPTSIYGQTKLCGEITGCNTATIRLPLLTSRLKNKQIVFKLLELVKSDRKIKVSNDVFSTPIIVEDFASILLKFILSDSFESGIHHASSNVLLSFSEVIRSYAASFQLCQDLIEDVSEDSFSCCVEKPKSLGLQSSHPLLVTEFLP